MNATQILLYDHCKLESLVNAVHTDNIGHYNAAHLGENGREDYLLIANV